MNGMRWVLAGALFLLFIPLAAPRAEAVDLTPAQIEQLLDAIKARQELLQAIKSKELGELADMAIDLAKLGIKNINVYGDVSKAIAEEMSKLGKLEDAINAIKMGRMRPGFIAPELLGGLVVLEMGIYLDSLAYEFNRDVMAATSNPDFTFTGPREEAMLTLNVTSSEYWKGVWDYWTTW